MGDEPAKREPISPPAKDHPDDKVRAFIEAGVGAVPLGGAVTRLVAELLPTQGQKARNVWEHSVSERTNENTARIDKHADLLSPKSSLSGVTAQLVTALARKPGDGMRGSAQTLDDLCRLVPEADRQAVEDAVFELNSYGVITITRAIGKHWWLHLTQNFYEQFDHQIMEWNTIDDAVELARLMLEDENMGRIPRLYEKSGWQKRRFNPALQHLLSIFPDGHISKELQPDYPTTYVHIYEEDRASLRRFVAAKKGHG
jgi:hypothetical protein